MTTKKEKYYTLTKIVHTGFKHNAKYYVVFGERSNGKTYSVKELAINGFKDGEVTIKGFIQDGSQAALIRRWRDDFAQKRGPQLFDDLVQNGSIKKWTNGEWDQVYYYSMRWYLAKFDEKLNKIVHDNTPFMFGFPLTAMEHDKSTSYPRVNKIIFDEFLTRQRYLPDEFVTLMNTLSTIIRDRDDVLIFMLGNTVNKSSPYFTEMGLTNVAKMNPGDIDVYTYGDSKLSVVVEYADTFSKNKKKSDVYFAFNNPKLKMITTGKWEMAIYPHCPCKYKDNDIKFIYFIEFEKNILQCEIVQVDGKLFTFIHRKTTEFKKIEKDLIYSCDFSPLPNHKRKLTKPSTSLEKKLLSFFFNEKVYYQDNEVGEVVRNYLEWCETDKFR